jgi:transglutaminase-like putative cysteine protease
MRRLCCWSAASVLTLLGASPLPAATILERSIDIEVRPDGSVSERERLRVRLDEPGDFSSWSVYPVYLDVNRELVSLSASATEPGGKTRQVKKKDQDTNELAMSGELHSSRKLRTVSFPAVPVGSVLAIEYEVRERPYFPAGTVYLELFDDRTESLRVTVRGPRLRWRIDGARPEIRTREEGGAVMVTASGLVPPASVDRQPSLTGGVLRYAWGDVKDWEAVGRWYEGLLAGVPRGSEAVGAKARELIADAPGRRERLERLVDFARRQVRYVAVQVGIGGFRPASAAETMDRLWGDCKGKAFLLIDLLREAGIQAYPALALLDLSGRVDAEFPAPIGQFNHMIVAVPADDLGLGPEAPVSGGYLFLDATQSRGALSWLHPAVQGQEVLVVRDGRGILVRTPIRHESEGRRLDVSFDLSAEGESTGRVRMDLSGAPGDAFLDLAAAGQPQEVDRAIREVLAYHLPAGAQLDGIVWQSMDGGVPAVTLEAKVQVPAAGVSTGPLPPLPLPSMTALPAPGLLDNRTVPVVSTPFTDRVTWRINLPKDSCSVDAQEVAVDNEVGAFRQTVKVEGKTLTLERSAGLRHRWIDPQAFPALKEVSLAESRTNKRRLRVGCQ